MFGHPGGYRSRAMHEERVIGVDLGGTKILAGLVARDGSIGRTIEIATPDGTQDEVLGAIDRVVDDLVADGAAAIGYGVPLNIDRRTGVALRAVNLPLHAVHFPERARERYALPAGVENDGNAAALAEWRLGAGHEASDLIMLTLGTGVGGGIVIDDRLYRGWAELGHVVVVAGRPALPGQLPWTGPSRGGGVGARGGPCRRDRCTGQAPMLRCSSPSRAEARRARSNRSRRSAGCSGSRSARWPTSSIQTWSSSVAASVLLQATSCSSLPRRAARVARRSSLPTRQLRIVQAELGDEAGLIGAALVGFEALDGVR